MTSIQTQVQQAVSVANLIGLIPGNLLAGNITNDQLAGGITSNKLYGNIPVGLLQDDGINGDIIISTGAGVQWITPSKITTGLPNPDVGGSNDGQYVTVASGAAGTFQYTTIIPPPTYSKNTLTGTIPTINNVVSKAHGYSGIPHCVRCVLVCTTANGLWTLNQEINIESVNIGGIPVFTVYVDSTNVNVYYTGPSGTATIGSKAMIIGDFTLKIYTVYFN